MKQIFTTFLIIIILLGCSSNITKPLDSNLSQVENIKISFISAIKGIWVLTDYIKEIEKTKSPLKSSDKLKGIVTMVINGNFQNDSITVGSSWDNHQGYGFTTYFVLGQKTNSLKTNIIDYDNKYNYYELGYEVINNDTVLILYHYNRQNKLLNRKQYNKVADSQQNNDLAWGLHYVVNEKLFFGNYILINSNNSPSKIQFKNDGSITGMCDFNRFEVSSDFAAPGPEGEPSDAICFNNKAKIKKCFSYKINSDTLYLKQGQNEYKLLRLKSK